MNDPSAETPLLGGYSTRGVVRVGNTVRRPPRRHAEFINLLLTYLAEVGFDGAPRYLGSDDLGRDSFSYVEGDAPVDVLRHDDATLIAVAQFIRCYHDATTGFVRGSPAGVEVICHNDLSPANLVFRNGQPIALIDFDTAAPGTRRMDFAFAAWCWLNLGVPEYSGDEQRRRMSLFVTAYGAGFESSQIKDAILLRQKRHLAEQHAIGNHSSEKWARDSLIWTAENL